MPGSSKLSAALYARVSTDEQDPELQLRALRDLAERRGWSLAGVYVDRGVSGSKDRRPELDRLMVDARERRFSVVAVWKFDRFARSVKHLVIALDDFRALEIDFVSVTEAIDTSTAAGRMVFSMIAAIAEFERELIRERVRAGIARRRAQGKPVGRQRRATVSQVERIRLLRAEGRSWRKIAMSVGLPLTTVRDSFREACGKPTPIRAAETAGANASEGVAVKPSG